MKILKKAFQNFKKNYLLLLFLNSVFLATTFALLYFTGKKIQSYVLMIYSYAPDLQDLQLMLSDSISKTDLSLLEEALAVINKSYTMILVLTIGSLIVFYLVWCFFQSLQWRITYQSLKKKVKLEYLFKNYWKYFLNFLLFNILVFLMIFPLFFSLMSYFGEAFKSVVFSFYDVPQPSIFVDYPILIILALLFIILTYFAILVYILLNKYKIIESIKRAWQIGLDNLQSLLLYHFFMALIIVPILVMDFFLAEYLPMILSGIISIVLYILILTFYQNLMVKSLEEYFSKK